jgi:hypothetical protein
MSAAPKPTDASAKNQDDKQKTNPTQAGLDLLQLSHHVFVLHTEHVSSRGAQLALLCHQRRSFFRGVMMRRNSSIRASGGHS